MRTGISILETQLSTVVVEQCTIPCRTALWHLLSIRHSGINGYIAIGMVYVYSTSEMPKFGYN